MDLHSCGCREHTVIVRGIGLSGQDQSTETLEGATGSRSIPGPEFPGQWEAEAPVEDVILRTFKPLVGTGCGDD